MKLDFNATSSLTFISFLILFQLVQFERSDSHFESAETSTFEVALSLRRPPCLCLVVFLPFDTSNENQML